MPNVPIPRLPRRIRAIPLWLREMVLVGVLYGFYELVRGLQSEAPGRAASDGWAILHFEQGLHLDPEAALTTGLVHVTWLAVPCAYFYSVMHYVITPIVLVWMYRCHKQHYRTARTALAISTLTALVLFWLVPTAPPRLLRGAHVPDALYLLRHWGWWGGDGSVPRGLGGITDQLAAMPSLHVGWALWSGFLIVRYARRRTVRVLGAIYPLMTAYVVLATGNHYLADVLAGAGVMVLGALGSLAVRRAARYLRHRRTRPVADHSSEQGSGQDSGQNSGQESGQGSLPTHEDVPAEDLVAVGRTT